MCSFKGIKMSLLMERGGCLTSALQTTGGAHFFAIPLAIVFCIGSGACGESVPAGGTVTEGKTPSLNGTLLVSQSVFGREIGPDGKTRPKLQPAKLALWSQRNGDWHEEVLSDPEANVFHKAMPFQEGILTLSGEAAKIKYWTRSNSGGWTGEEIWAKSWGGKFNRMRDVEVADLDGDGAQEMVVATHDMGVIGLGRSDANGGWTFQEYGAKPDTFVHEIEVGDVDGDGKLEAYATPSDRNRGDLSAQAGGVVQYRFVEGVFTPSKVVDWADTHAKEITVVPQNGGADVLYAVKEASKTASVQVVTLTPGPEGWVEETVAELDGEKQARFLVSGDPDGDGQNELVIAGKNTGLWLLEPDGNGQFSTRIIDGTSGGFEQATHLADLNGDGRSEIYVASERPGQTRQLRQYDWDGKRFQRQVLTDLEGMGIAWHVSHGSF